MSTTKHFPTWQSFVLTVMNNRFFCLYTVLLASSSLDLQHWLLTFVVLMDKGYFSCEPLKEPLSSINGGDDVEICNFFYESLHANNLKHELCCRTTLSLSIGIEFLQHLLAKTEPPFSQIDFHFQDRLFQFLVERTRVASPLSPRKSCFLHQVLEPTWIVLTLVEESVHGYDNS